MSPTNMRSAAPSRQRIHCLIRESDGRNSIPDPGMRMSLLNIRFWVPSPKYSLLQSFDSHAHIPNHLRSPNQRDTRSEALSRLRNYCRQVYSHVYTPNRIHGKSPTDRHSQAVLWQNTPPRPVESPACIPTQSRTVLPEH